ncbi:MAG: Methylmalonyl-CoA carboxyltransferase 1.3S subunit [Calditrichaeota bacterium]|nr:Methylmalonyl-CoA carboxyltransferase 1.3S subunit [Calditrichota bacterium]
MTDTNQKDRYRVEVDGVTCTVAFLPDGRVQVDDTVLSLDVVEDTTPGHFSFLIDRESRLLAIEPGDEPNRYRVNAGGYDFELHVLSERESFLHDYLRAAGVGKKEGRVKATMPGLIRKILVKPGDSVEAGQGVLIMEAMKMENEIRSPIPGRVLNLEVDEGEAVEKGAGLFEVETS